MENRDGRSTLCRTAYRVFAIVPYESYFGALFPDSSYQKEVLPERWISFTAAHIAFSPKHPCCRFRDFWTLLSGYWPTCPPFQGDVPILVQSRGWATRANLESPPIQ